MNTSSYFVLVVSAALLVSCERAPSDVDLFEKSTELVERYLSTTDASDAEAAMLELEAYTRHCQMAGTRSVDFDLHYAAIYSRLYLAEQSLGKVDSAKEHLQKAEDYWRKVFIRKGTAQPTQVQIRSHIDGMTVGPWATGPAGE